MAINKYGLQGIAVFAIFVKRYAPLHKKYGMQPL